MLKATWSWWGSADKCSPGSPEERQVARWKRSGRDMHGSNMLKTHLDHLDHLASSWDFLIKRGFLMILDVYESNLLRRLHPCFFPKAPGQFPNASPFTAVLRTVSVNVHLFPQTKAGTDSQGSDLVRFPSTSSISKEWKERNFRGVWEICWRTIRTCELDLLICNGHVLSKFLRSYGCRTSRLSWRDLQLEPQWVLFSWPSGTEFLCFWHSSVAHAETLQSVQ